MKLKAHIILSSLALLFSSSVFAASVSAVKGQQALVNLEGDTVSEGEEFYLINPETQKKTAIIRIKKVKDQKALAEITKGKAASGYTLQAKAPAPMSADVKSESPQEDAPVRKLEKGILHTLKDSYGVMGGYIMSSMSADVSYKDPNLGTTTRASTSMSGSGFGVGGFYDYVVNQDIVGRGYAGLEQFTASGSASNSACSGSTNCTANINYLSLYGLLKWYPLHGKYRGWVGGGMGYLLALSKSSSALNESQISTNQVFTFALGSDIQMSRKNYIPVSLEYNLFPSSDTVKASQILLKAGWAWNL